MKKVFLVAVAVVLVSGLILSGCAKPAPAPAAAPAPAPAPAPPSTPDKYGGVLKIATTHPGKGFGYPPGLRGADVDYANLCLQRLLGVDEEGALQPQLATSWELSPDEKYYTVHLRKGVKFHDGTDFNAQAVKWNLDEIKKAKSLTVTQVTSIDVIDDYTVRLNLSEWDSLILTHLAADGHAFMISPTAVEKNGAKWAEMHPVGTGPFKVEEFMRNVPVKYERFDDYWDEGLPYLDGIEITYMPDPMTRLISLKAGDVDVVIGVELADAADLQVEGHFDLGSVSVACSNVFFNTRDPECIYADKRVRQAIEYAIDKEAMAKALGYGFTRATYEMIPRVYECPGKVLRKYDPDKARQLLAEAGYPDGFKTEILIEPRPERKTDAVALQGYLAEVGIDLEVNVVEFVVCRTVQMEGGLGESMFMAPYRSPVNSLYSADMNIPSTTPNAPIEMARTPGLEDMLAQAKKEKDPDKVTELLYQMEKLAYDDAMFVPFLGGASVGAMAPYLHDYGLFHPAGFAMYDLSRAWLSER